MQIFVVQVSPSSQSKLPMHTTSSQYPSQHFSPESQSSSSAHGAPGTAPTPIISPTETTAIKAIKVRTNKFILFMKGNNKKDLNILLRCNHMNFRKYFAYFMIITGILLEFFTFELCSRTMCYFFEKCSGDLSVECLASYFVASLLLVIGGLWILSENREKRYY
jgi:hypothetical protein